MDMLIVISTVCYKKKTSNTNMFQKQNSQGKQDTWGFYPNYVCV